MTSSRPAPNWYETGEQARRCLALALVQAAHGLDFAGAGGGVRLPRRLVQITEAFERVIETADRQYRIEQAKAERAARLQQLAAERERAREATFYGRR